MSEMTLVGKTQFQSHLADRQAAADEQLLAFVNALAQEVMIRGEAEGIFEQKRKIMSAQTNQIGQLTQRDMAREIRLDEILQARSLCVGKGNPGTFYMDSL
jgi:hypothetical protein